MGDIAWRRSLVCTLRGMMIVIVAGFIPLSLLSIVSTRVMWEGSQWLGKNIVCSAGKKNSREVWIGALANMM